MVALIDTTMRDGAQALWSGRLPKEDLLPIGLSLDNAGFRAIDCMAGIQFEISVKFLKENPWHRLRAIRRVITETPLTTHIRSRSLSSFDLMPLEAIKLYIERAAANGFRRIMIFDALHDLDNMRPSIEFARNAGLHVATVIFYTLSPFHTDEYYARVAENYVSLGADSVCLRDPSGLLTPERTRSLVPILRRALGETPLELKSHCSTGLAPSCYVEAARCGVDALFTATSPLANGASVPATEEIAERVAEFNGGLPPVDVGRVAEVAGYLTRYAETEGKPVGEPVEGATDTQYRHQVPGGMIAFLRDQLADLGQSDKLEAVLEEITVVREEMGYPVMVTPISQLVGVQAVLNVLHGRYSMIPKEVRRYVLGQYGRPEGPLAPDLVDRVGKGEAGDIVEAENADLLERIRREQGPFESDDELILHIMFHAKMLADIPPFNARSGDAIGSAASLAELMGNLKNYPRIGRVSLSGSNFNFTARRG